MGYLHTHAMHKPLYIPLALAIAALLLAAHLACSSSSGATYERGTPTRPPPAQTRPGVGLPVHDPQSKPLPPQPNPKPKRLLPPSREPGIWAADPPKASSEPGAAPAIFNWDVPLPENDEPAADKIKACAQDMKHVTPHVLLQHNIDKMDSINREAWRACWPHSVIVYCLKFERDMLGLVRPMDRIGQKKWDALERALERAGLSWAEHCNAAPWEPIMKHLAISAAKARGAK